MKKIFLIVFLSFFISTITYSQIKENDYILFDVSDLLKRGFKIVKQENYDGVENVFLTNNRDFVVCRILMRVTVCSKQ